MLARIVVILVVINMIVARTEDMLLNLEAWCRKFGLVVQGGRNRKIRYKKKGIASSREKVGRGKRSLSVSEAGIDPWLDVLGVGGMDKDKFKDLAILPNSVHKAVSVSCYTEGKPGSGEKI